jgi:siroheme synthase-like protein
MQYPVFLVLKNEPCLVVGGRAVAERKVEGLLTAGADICVIAPTLTKGLEQLCMEGRIRCQKRMFGDSDIKDFKLVFAATNNRAVNKHIAVLSNLERVWCNVADSPEECNFFVPSRVNRGMLQMAVSTSGAAPELSKSLRQQFELLLGEEVIPVIEQIQMLRKQIIEGAGPDEQLKKRLMAEKIAPLIESVLCKLRT